MIKPQLKNLVETVETRTSGRKGGEAGRAATGAKRTPRAHGRQDGGVPTASRSHRDCQRSDRHVVRGAFGGRNPAFIIDLGGGDVAVAQEILDLADIDPSAEK
jgi:hypothetical protein